MAIDRRSMLRWSGVGASALMFGGCALAAQDTSWPGKAVGENELPKLPIGMNLAGVNDFEPGFPFRNLMWGARPWLTHNADGSGPWHTNKNADFGYDDNGYPLEVPIRVAGMDQPQGVFTVLPNVRKPGKYVLLHDGEGEFAGALGTRIISRAKGRLLLQMTHKPPLAEVLSIVRSKAGNPVRNIRIVALEDENVDLAADPFLPEFLDFCRPFHALRFMDWGATNNSIEREWSDRRRPGFYTMIGSSGDLDDVSARRLTPFQLRFAGGVAHEVMIALANKLEIDPWFCIPHRASDDYIVQFARLVREKLDPRRTVYVEYSNEIWNWAFWQSQWMLNSRLAGDLVESKGGRAWKDGTKTKGDNHPARIGALFGRAFRLWEREWQGADRKRLVTVCATQTAWLEVAMGTLDACIEHGGVDAVAQTGYFGAPADRVTAWEAQGAALTGAEVVRDCAIWLRQQATEGGAALAMARRAKKLGMPYLIYEGGQHLQPKGQADLPYKVGLGAAQMHPGMYDLYLAQLRFSQHLDCALFCAFNSVGVQGTRYGSWGAKSSYDQPDAEAPKYRALIDANVARA